MKKVDQCLKDLGSVYQGCEAEISELVYQIDKMLNDKQTEWELSYKQLLDENRGMHEILSNNQFELREKDTEINDLRQEIVKINKSNYEKRMILESKITGLSQNNSTNFCSRCYAHSSPEACRESHDISIKELKEECNSHLDKIAELEIHQTTQIAQIKLLEEQRSSLLRKNEDLKYKFSNARKEYHAKLKDTEDEMKLFVDQKKKYESTISDLKANLNLKDDELQNMKTTLEDVLSSNHKNNSLFSNMKNDFNSLKDEKEILVKDVDDLKTKLKSLEDENVQLLDKVSSVSKDAENKEMSLKKENELVKAQIGIYEKENQFLQSFLIKQDLAGSPLPAGFLEKLEADNHSLKENIVSMEREIAGIIKITEESFDPKTSHSPSSRRKEVEIVKERYERHLMNMKAEIEQLKIENISLKIKHQDSNHNEHADVSVIDDKSSFMSYTEGKCVDERLQSLSPSHMPTVNNSEKSFTMSDNVCSVSSNPFTDEFAKMQQSVLEKFEAKLEECVSTFKSDSA